MRPPQAKPSNGPYVMAVMGLAALAVLCISGVAVFRPGQDNMPLYILITGFTTTTGAAILAFMKAQETHLSVNSRLDQFIENEARASRSEGELAGRAGARVEAKEDKK